MIDPDMRNAIFQLHQEGMALREISRCLHVSRNAVRRIVRQQGKTVRKERKDRIQIAPELLERLHQECNGWIERVHEKLLEEEKIQVGYSTLARILRDMVWAATDRHAATEFPTSRALKCSMTPPSIR